MAMEARAELVLHKEDEERDTSGSSVAISAYSQTPGSDVEGSGQILNTFA